MKHALLLLLAILPIHTAFGHGAGNGGSNIALEFKRTAFDAIQIVQLNNGRFSELKSLNLLKILGDANVIVVDQDLFVEVGTEKTEVVAINSKDPDTITIHGAKWLLEKDEQVRRSLALHELLGLAGIEKSGVYTYSQLLLRDPAEGSHIIGKLANILMTAIYKQKFSKCGTSTTDASDPVNTKITCEVVNLGCYSSNPNYGLGLGYEIVNKVSCVPANSKKAIDEGRATMILSTLVAAGLGGNSPDGYYKDDKMGVNWSIKSIHCESFLGLEGPNSVANNFCDVTLNQSEE